MIVKSSKKEIDLKFQNCSKKKIKIEENSIDENSLCEEDIRFEETLLKIPKTTNSAVFQTLRT